MFSLFRVLFIASVSVSVAQATIVKLDIAFGDISTDEVFVNLLDADTPATVTNFLNYIENGVGDRRFDNTFFHRSIGGFIIQGGSFLYDPGDVSADANGFVSVVIDAPVVNEFDVSRSNVRGTLAMAKLGGDPDSATSGWFFNLADNSGNLDNQNGGFTVFANVSGDGMQVVDEMAALDTISLGGAFTDLPATDTAAVDNANLLRIIEVNVYVAPQAATISTSNTLPLDFGVLGQASVLQIDIPLSNVGIDPLTITSVTFVGPGSANFSAINDCGALAFAERCTATLTYVFTVAADTTNLALEILSDDPNTPQLLLPVTVILSSDADGIPDAVEIAGPNGGDANEDGVADVLQDNVASFPDINGQYIVLEVDPALVLVDVQAQQNPSPTDTPVAATGVLSFDQGFFSFSIEGVPIGGVASVTLTLPDGITTSTYFNFGRLPGEQIAEHWYQFSFDGETGAQISGNQITLQFTDGERGDHDQTEDGRIESLGGPPAGFLTVVRLDIAIGDQSTEEIYIELFETEAPLSVSNFLNYIENGAGDRRYDGTFFHRSNLGRALFGGEYRLDSQDIGPVLIVKDDPIVNEFSLARLNLRGTISMDKDATSASVTDSATSGWFFNVVDRSGRDTEDGGYAVFGNVIGNGMLVVDEISALPVRNLGIETFSSLPVTDVLLGVDDSTLIRLVSAEIYSIPQSAVVSISETSLLDFGDMGPGSERQLQISIANLGRDVMTIQSVGFTGADAARGSSTSNCVPLEFGASCTETLTLSFGSGVPLADLSLEILSSDPSNPQQLIPVQAVFSADNDGISDAVEAAGPNAGDANNDGIADILQDNVTSFPNANGDYVVLEVDGGLTLTGVEATSNPSNGNLPISGLGSLSFDYGFFSFTLENVPVGAAATVTLALPAGQAAPTNYFKFGRSSPFAANDSWYLFDFNGVTGARVQGNEIVLHLVDGGAGDSDQVADGRIVDPGGPALLSLPSSSTGGGGCSIANSVQDRTLYSVDLIVLLFAVIWLLISRGSRASRFYTRS